MDTDSSETILTDRRGCLDRTLDASSCTQIDIAMRCAMFTKSDMNSKTPDTLETPAVPFSFALVRRIEASSSRTYLNDAGTAASTTASASTMPMSSSSVRFASWAASSSSVAMPNDTEKARSDPSELRAPAVLIPASSAGQVASTAQIRAFSQEGDVLHHLLAWQEGMNLSIRHLLVCPISASDTPGRGGKATRRRVGNSHVHSYSGCVFGCLLGNLATFARGNKDRRFSEMVASLRKHLEPASRDISSCKGVDAEHLRRGFACCTVIRGQLLALPESRRNPRVNSRYGKTSVAVGMGAALFFLLSSACDDERDATALRLSTEMWAEWSVRALGRWRKADTVADPEDQAALEAERRALQRGLLAIRVAKKEAARLQLKSHSAVKLEVACMRRAMWPANSCLDRVAHAQICEWIHSPEFLSDAAPPPASVQGAVQDSGACIPLSALHDFAEPGRESDTESVSDSSSISGWSSSTGSMEGDLVSRDMNALAIAVNSGMMGLR